MYEDTLSMIVWLHHVKGNSKAQLGFKIDSSVRGHVAWEETVEHPPEALLSRPDDQANQHYPYELLQNFEHAQNSLRASHRWVQMTQAPGRALDRHCPASSLLHGPHANVGRLLANREMPSLRRRVTTP